MTVGRVHEASEKIFGDTVGLDLGRGQIQVVEGVSPGRPRRTSTQKILGLTVVAIRGEHGWKGLGLLMSRW